MNVEECVEKGLLRKERPDKGKALRSLETAERKLKLSKRELGAGIFEGAVISAYASMFHSARALLYQDGFKERSHYCLFVYVQERYSGKIEQRFLNELNVLRMERHGLMYGLEERSEVAEGEAKDAVSVAGEFLKSVRKLLEKREGC